MGKVILEIISVIILMWNINIFLILAIILGVCSICNSIKDMMNNKKRIKRINKIEKKIRNIQIGMNIETPVLTHR